MTPREFVSLRAQAFRRLFDRRNLDAQTVLADLARFCRAHQSTHHPDSHAAARLDGRREVWLRICQQLDLSDQELWQLFGARGVVDPSPSPRGDS